MRLKSAVVSWNAMTFSLWEYSSGSEGGIIDVAWEMKSAALGTGVVTSLGEMPFALANLSFFTENAVKSNKTTGYFAPRATCSATPRPLRSPVAIP
jgi:hypothetical protein